MLVKCQVCGEKIDKSTAYCVAANGRNKYYCNKTEYDKKILDNQQRAMIVDLSKSYLNNTENTALHKEIKSWGEDKAKIISFLTENRERIERSMRKDFNNEYAKIRYFSAIVKNSINDYVMPQTETVEKQVEVEMYESKYKPKPKRKCLSDYKGVI